MKNLKQTGLIFLMIVCASTALADGMMITSAPYYIQETAQQALITYDQSSSLETLQILPSFRGDTNNFAWILPVPNLPELEEGDAQIFRDLRNMTQGITHYRDGNWDSGCNRYSVDYESSMDNGIEIIDSQLVGYYQTMILAADQAPALLDSLLQWGFLHDENIEQATNLITAYVEDDWYFVTVKVDSTSFAEIFPFGYGYYAQLEPLAMTFNSDEIVYPMRISALSAAESTEVNLYFIGQHRMDFDGASTQYANLFTTPEYESISAYSPLKLLISPGDFLTRLEKTFNPNQMTEDLTIVRANNDDEYLAINYSGVPWVSIFLMGPPVLWGLYRWLTRKRKDAAFSS